MLIPFYMAASQALASVLAWAMQALQHEAGTNIVANGALATLSGAPHACMLRTPPHWHCMWQGGTAG